MINTSEPANRELPQVVGARRLLASGQLGAELVRLAEAAAEIDRDRASRLAAVETGGDWNTPPLVLGGWR